MKRMQKCRRSPIAAAIVRVTRPMRGWKSSDLRIRNTKPISPMPAHTVYVACAPLPGQLRAEESAAPPYSDEARDV